MSLGSGIRVSDLEGLWVKDFGCRVQGWSLASGSETLSRLLVYPLITHIIILHITRLYIK